MDESKVADVSINVGDWAKPPGVPGGGQGKISNATPIVADLDSTYQDSNISTPTSTLHRNRVSHWKKTTDNQKVIFPGSRSYNRRRFIKNEDKTDLKSDWTTKSANYHLDFHSLWLVAKLYNSFIFQNLLSNGVTDQSQLRIWVGSAKNLFCIITVRLYNLTLLFSHSRTHIAKIPSELIWTFYFQHTVNYNVL